MLVQSHGPRAIIGEICTIKIDSSKTSVLAEVVGLEGSTVNLMVYGETKGIEYGDEVIGSGHVLEVRVDICSVDGFALDDVNHPAANALAVAPTGHTAKQRVVGQFYTAAARPDTSGGVLAGIDAADGTCRHPGVAEGTVAMGPFVAGQTVAVTLFVEVGHLAQFLVAGITERPDDQEVSVALGVAILDQGTPLGGSALRCNFRQSHGSFTGRGEILVDGVRGDVDFPFFIGTRRGAEVEVDVVLGERTRQHLVVVREDEAPDLGNHLVLAVEFSYQRTVFVAIAHNRTERLESNAANVQEDQSQHDSKSFAKTHKITMFK